MNDLDWEQKFRALYALGVCSIVPVTTFNENQPAFKVYVNKVEIKDGGTLKSASATAKNIATAVENLWSEMVDPKTIIIRNAYGSNRTSIRWNGFMWEEHPDA